MLELRELLQEGHGLVKDLTRLIREVQQLRDSLPETVNAKISDAVASGLEEYKATLAEAIEDATNSVYKRFDVLTAICLGQDPHSVRTGVTTIPNLLRDFIATKGLPYRLVHVPPGLVSPEEPS